MCGVEHLRPLGGDSFVKLRHVLHRGQGISRNLSYLWWCTQVTLGELDHSCHTGIAILSCSGVIQTIWLRREIHCRERISWTVFILWLIWRPPTQLASSACFTFLLMGHCCADCQGTHLFLYYRHPWTAFEWMVSAGQPEVFLFCFLSSWWVGLFWGVGRVGVGGAYNTNLPFYLPSPVVSLDFLLVHTHICDPALCHAGLSDTKRASFPFFFFLILFLFICLFISFLPTSCQGPLCYQGWVNTTRFSFGAVLPFQLLNVNMFYTNRFLSLHLINQNVFDESTLGKSHLPFLLRQLRRPVNMQTKC